MECKNELLRSFPIEYYCFPSDLFNETNYIISHESTYYGLDALSKLYKLDDFALEYDLNALLGEIISSQVNDISHSLNGAFSILKGLSPYANTYHHVKYSYYAIRCLEILAKFLDLGDLKDLSFSWNALYNYLKEDMVETDTMIYYLSSINSNASMSSLSAKSPIVFSITFDFGFVLNKIRDMAMMIV